MKTETLYINQETASEYLNTRIAEEGLSREELRKIINILISRYNYECEVVFGAEAKDNIHLKSLT